MEMPVPGPNARADPERVGFIAERTFRRVAPRGPHRGRSRVRYGGPWLRLLAQGHAMQRGETGRFGVSWQELEIG